jgi:peptidoglycan/xylan/chitin deacetylase (PgdA/CDA1 family)
VRFPGSKVKAEVRRLLGRALFGAGLDAVLLHDTAMVVAFHRVHDTGCPEPLTVSVRAFEQYCRFFRDHFRVVSLGELVTRMERGLSLRRELAITFDDGYLDNHDTAAPILERLGLPATFFVVTQWMGTDLVPWWDRVRDIRHPWMTWDHVRALSRRGFEIGAHTRTHVDLGVVPADEAQREIAGARRELERQLGAPVDLFAYPYGRRQNLSDSNLELVRQAGFRCCCSCFGGVNTRSSDPFHLARIAVTPRYDSPHQLGLEVALRRTVVTAFAGSSVPVPVPGSQLSVATHGPDW